MKNIYVLPPLDDDDDAYDDDDDDDDDGNKQNLQCAKHFLISTREAKVFFNGVLTGPVPRCPTTVPEPINCPILFMRLPVWILRRAASLSRGGM